jgi:hypothetical protein
MTPSSEATNSLGRGSSGCQIASSQAANTAEEVQVAAKKQKRQAAATETGAATKPKPKKKTSHGK